jgi:hypothetical protein
VKVKKKQAQAQPRRVDYVLRLALPSHAAHLIVRTDSVLCSGCGISEPVHPGDGTPMPTFVDALYDSARRHMECVEMKRKRKGS